LLCQALGRFHYRASTPDNGRLGLLHHPCEFLVPLNRFLPSASQHRIGAHLGDIGVFFLGKLLAQWRVVSEQSASPINALEATAI
jgi:hypothetical protein